VCPNDANFYFEVEPVEILYNNVKITEEGWVPIEGGVFTIRESHQLATFADACNDCGNCDVFCPEDGGPYLEKPRFFGSINVWRRWNKLDGFVLTHKDGKPALHGRIRSSECELLLDEQSRTAHFHAHGVVVVVDWDSYKILDVEHWADAVGKTIEMMPFLSMAMLMKGMLHTDRVHFVNVDLMRYARNPET
jgi:putative selenate reductase